MFPSQIRVAIDVGCERHRVAVGLSDGHGRQKQKWGSLARPPSGRPMMTTPGPLLHYVQIVLEVPIRSKLLMRALSIY